MSKHSRILKMSLNGDDDGHEGEDRSEDGDHDESGSGDADDEDDE